MKFLSRVISGLCLSAWLAGLAMHPARAYDYRPNLANPAYTSCEENDDCKVIYPRCGAPLAVNQRHFYETDSWYRNAGRYETCADWIALPKVKKESCVNHRCTLELTRPEPPTVDNSKEAKDPTYCDKNDDCAVVLGDCCEKSFYNKKNAARIQADIDYRKGISSTCFFPDRRHVANLRCENHRCTADLIVPIELRDPDHDLKDKCAQ